MCLSSNKYGLKSQETKYLCIIFKICRQFLGALSPDPTGWNELLRGRAGMEMKRARTAGDGCNFCPVQVSSHDINRLDPSNNSVISTVCTPH